MYQKKNNNNKMVLGIAGIVAAGVVGLAAVNTLPGILKSRNNTGTVQQQSQSVSESETEEQKYQVTIYKSEAADIMFESKFLETNNDETATLMVPADEMMTVMVAPTEGWDLNGIQIIDHNLNTVNEVTLKNTDGSYRINFVMPASELVMNFTYINVDTGEEIDADGTNGAEEVTFPASQDPFAPESETASETQSEAVSETATETPVQEDADAPTDETVDPNAEDVTETPTSESPQTDTTAPTPETQENTNSQVIVPTSQETEVVTEVVDANPYGLTLHNLTAEIIASYNGQFDDKEFLQAVGDTLKVGVNGSPYQAVTDVYFSSENYTGVRESGKVYHYIYFNNNTNWEVLSIYYMSNGEYIFTEVPDETEAPTASNQGSNGSSTSSGGTVVNGGTTTNGGTTSNTTYVQPQTQIVTTSLDILQVSKKFLDYVGQDAFYDAAFQYVLKSGLTGQIQGTMKDYKINEEKGKAVINIDLTNGKSIKGVYLTETKEFSFTGLE